MHGLTGRVSAAMGAQDESDEMLNRGFKEQIYDVYRYLPPELQVPHATSSQALETGYRLQVTGYRLQVTFTRS